jgi:exonuclease SbcC
VKIHKIHLRNLNSLRTTVTLDFDVPPLSYSGLFAITGDTGAGKTTILDAITLALYGKTSREHQGEVMSNGAATAVAELEFENESGRYLTRWEQRRKKKGEFITERSSAQWKEGAFVPQTIGIKKTAEFIEGVLAMTYEQFKRTVLLAQGEFTAFLNPAVTGGKKKEDIRAEVLERITGTDIYSQLSIAAFERAKTEKNLLDLLEEKQQGLLLFDPVGVEQERRRRTALQEDIVRIRQHAEVLQDNKNALLQMESLAVRRKEMEARLLALSQERQSLQEDEQRLTRHGLALPFRSNLHYITATRSELEFLEKSLQQALESVSMAAGVQEQQSRELSVAHQHWYSLQQDFQKDQALFDRVIALDERGDSLKKQVTDAANVWQSVLEQQQKLAAALQEKANRQAHIRKQKQEAENWLLDHQEWGGLAPALHKAENHVERLRQLYAEKRRLEKDRADNQQQRNEASARRGRLLVTLQMAEESMNAQKKEWEAWNQRHALSSAVFEAEQQLDERVEEATAHLQQIEDFIRYHSEYRRLAERLAEARDEYESLRAEEFSLGKDLLVLFDEIPHLQQVCTTKKMRLDLQQKFLTLAEIRGELQQGQPCPVCGSVEHPAIDWHAEELENDARQEWEQAQKVMHEAERRLEQIKMRQGQMNSRLAKFEEDVEETMDMEMRRLIEELRVREHQFSIRDVGFLENTAAQKGFLEQKQKELFARKQEQEALRHQHNRFVREAHSGMQTLTDRKSEFQQAQTRWEIAESHAVALQEQCARLDESYGQEEEALNLLLLPFKVRFEPNGGFKSAFESLKDTVRKYTEKQQYVRDAATEDYVLSAAIEELEKNLTGQMIQINEKRTDLEDRRQQLADIEAERYHLLDTKDLREERLRRQQEVESAQNHLEQAQEKNQQQREHVARLREAAETYARRITEKNDLLADAQKQLAAALPETPFATAEELTLAILPEEEARQIESEKQLLEQQWSNLMQTIQENDREREKAEAQPLPFRDANALNIEIEETAGALETRQQETGKIDAALAEYERQMKRSSDLLQQIAVQRAAFQSWEALRKLIGSADGAIFRRFAQGLTLRQLVQQTNRHLARLQGGRYRLRKKDGPELDLEIIDTFQADNVRSVNTLSGGETFLASLALALGLADMTGLKSRVQSLFIDEGFGSLDETALEIAIDTLESLQAQGLTIGVISHVREMKERIAVQVQVKKQSDGFSTVQMTG